MYHITAALAICLRIKYYFSKDKISYMVIGNMKSDIFNLLIDYIEESDFEIVDIVDNL